MQTTVQRIRQGTAATLQVVITNSVGTPTAAAGAVTVGVTRGSGATVIAAGTATANTSTGVYTVPVTAAHTALLDELTATWSAGGVSWVTRHRVVGGFLFSLADVRTVPALSDDTDPTDEVVLAKRVLVEEEVEWICDRSFVPAYRRVVLSGSGSASVVSGVHDIRAIRSITIYPTTGATSGTVMDASALAQVAWFPDGKLERTDGGVFPNGLRNIAVELEYGLDQPAEDLMVAALLRLQDRLQVFTSGVPERARSWNPTDGTPIDLDDVDPYRTGLVEVDAVYGRYSKRQRAGRPDGPGAGEVVAASRPLHFNPQYHSLFRGGDR